MHITIDTSFIPYVIDYLQSNSVKALTQIVSHSSALKTYAHALRFGNTSLDIKDYWLSILDRERKRIPENLETIAHCLEDVKDKSKYQMMYSELGGYLPEDFHLECTLYASVGYDIGIVSEGSALVNFAHPAFRDDIRELLYICMHELHHVAYTHYNSLFSLEDIKKTKDLLRIIEYSTHMEGLAVYAPLEMRISQHALSHEDYKVLLDEIHRESRVEEYFSIYDRLVQEQDRPIQEGDMGIIEEMSGRNQRLWYIAGAHMSRVIDETMGRQSLIRTIPDGPESFFAAYFECVD